MQCDHCGQRPATVHQTVISNGHKQESHLCEVCVPEKGGLFEQSQTQFSFPNLSIHQLLTSFLGQNPLGGPAVVAPRRAEPQCKNCGMTYSQFADSGRLGCAQCYDYLEPHLEPLIERIHGTSTHHGKVPKRTGGLLATKRELDALKRRLQEAISQEQYEEAVQLRDAIRALESQIQAGGDSHAVE